MHISKVRSITLDDWEFEVQQVRDNVYIHVYMHVYMHIHAECRGFESHPRQLVFLRKSHCLGCAVLLSF